MDIVDFVDMSAYPENEVVFQQDGYPKHTAKIVKDWLSHQIFQVIECPAQSPDLNPIENSWAILKRRLGKYQKAPRSKNELWPHVQHEWNNFHDNFIQNLVESMPKHIKSVIKNKGLWTKY